MDGEYIEPYEREQLDSLIDRWRPRLYDISWFMKVLNENIAKRANQEDLSLIHISEPTRPY